MAIKTNRKISFQIQDRDREILKSVAELRFMETRQIIALYGGDRHPEELKRKEGTGQWNLRKRLQKMTQLRYLSRPREQYFLYRKRKHCVYALGNRGADELYGSGTDARGIIDWTQKNREVQFKNIDHALMVSDFIVALQLALKNHPEIELARWEREPVRDKVAVPNRVKQQTVRPDAFITLRQKSSNNNFHFFLEADRSTMSNPVFGNKAVAYWKWKMAGGHKRKLEIANFSVLTITKSRERAENIRAETAKNISTRGGKKLFFFAPEVDFVAHDSDQLLNPEKLLAPIWRQPAGEEAVSFLSVIKE